MSSPRPRSALLGGFFLAMLALSSAHAAGVRQFSPQGEVGQPIRATAVFPPTWRRSADPMARRHLSSIAVT